MNITEAETLLGLSGQKYDNQGIQIAYLQASKGKSYGERKRLREARETLERYYRSLRLTHQIDGAYSSEAMLNGIKRLRSMRGTKHDSSRKASLSDDEPVAPSSSPSRSSRSVGKSVLMALWDITPWRCWLVFWSTIIGVTSWLVSVLIPSVEPLTQAIDGICVLAFVIGIIDAFWLHKGTDIGNWLSRRIDAIE